MTENKIQQIMIAELRDMFPDWFVFPMSGSDYQGFPDILILYKDTYAVLEVKREIDSPKQPNQDYYIRFMSKCVFSSFIWPDVKEEVYRDLQHALLSGR